MIQLRNVSHKVSSSLFINPCWPKTHAPGGFYFNSGCFCVVLSDEPLPRQNNQAQAAEDILDKYRNIKKPSDVASAGTSYDGPGGQGTELLHTDMLLQ